MILVALAIPVAAILIARLVMASLFYGDRGTVGPYPAAPVILVALVIREAANATVPVAHGWSQVPPCKAFSLWSVNTQ